MGRQRNMAVLTCGKEVESAVSVSENTMLPAEPGAILTGAASVGAVTPSGNLSV